MGRGEGFFPFPCHHKTDEKWGQLPTLPTSGLAHLPGKVWGLLYPVLRLVGVTDSSPA